MGIEVRPSKTPWEKRAAIVAGITPHEGECPRCRAWRRDGAPPTVHFHGCGLGPDGAQFGLVEFRLPAFQHEFVDRRRS